MRLLALGILLLFLFSCSSTELPPAPSPPGSVGAGHAIGGIPISSLPSWAGPIVYTDITPASTQPGTNIVVTVPNPGSTQTVGPQTFDVSMEDFSFIPASLTINAGDSVRFTNRDSVAHTASGDTFDTGSIPASGVKTLQFNVPGTFAYHCNFHSGMNGSITVLPSTGVNKFYVYGFMYAYDKKDGVWQKFPADTSQSGTVTKDWVQDRAVFSIPSDTSRYVFGQNYLVTYWCIDTGARDANGNKIWNCNNNRWGLGAFELKSQGYPDILIEQNIGGNTYTASARNTTLDGDAYDATYTSGTTQTTARFLNLTNAIAYKKILSDKIPLLQSIWNTRGVTCGFLQQDSSTTSFIWFSNNSLITVRTMGSTLDDPTVNAYGAKYPSNCNLLDELRRIAAGYQGYCGNNVIETPEQCDGTNDTACPGLCKPDCTCAVKGAPNSGTCGDFLVQQPNANGVTETCEPPEKREPVTGQAISGSACYTKDVLSNVVTGIGHCNPGCQCIAGTATYPNACGNGVCDAGETAVTCPADCPNDTSPPYVFVLSPTNGLVFNTTSLIYSLSSTDLSGIASCTASTDRAAPETLSQLGILFTLTKTLAVGNHTASFVCTDKLGFASPAINSSFAIRINSTNATNTSNLSNQSNITINGNFSTVVIKNSTFGPVNITVHRGDLINFVNNDTVAHTATSDTNGIFDTGQLAAGQNKTITIINPGNYTYHCSNHQSMHGTITVT